MVILVQNFKDIWRVSLVAGAPACLPPMKIQLKTDAAPTRVKLRRYPPEQCELLKQLVNTLVENGHGYRNLNATWCSAPLIVPKDGPAKFRFTVDLKPVNKHTITHGEQFTLRWRGPRIVTRVISEHLYEENTCETLVLQLYTRVECDCTKSRSVGRRTN